MAIDVGAARQRIIRRPRLTSMLDESTAQIRLLIAPAGYGKTTLAREWLGEPKYRDVWYRGGPASADVAALAAGISEAAGQIVPEAGRRMLDRLRATGHPEEDVEILAELFAEDVQEWPSDAWLAFDDYQFAMDSVASERFVDFLTQQTPVQMLITSRRRPSWATARRILYGEILEIDRRALAMEDTEARAVVDRDDPALDEILQLARGWPAVIGLVGLNSDLGGSHDALPDQLYDYFAQELYAALPEPERLPLAELSFAINFDRHFAEELQGAGASQTIEAGLRVGVLAQPHRDAFEIHPLFSNLLQEQAFPLIEERRKAGTKAGHILVKGTRWDDAFELACRLELPELLVAAMNEALEALIRHGRLATITRWLEAAATLHAQSPIMDLAEAEVAFRIGDRTKAEALATQAAKRLDPGSRLVSRAYVRAGHGALLDSREEESIGYFRKAQETATEPRQLREALFGLYSATSELERPEAETVLEHLRELELETPDDYLRSLAIELTHAVRSGKVDHVLRSVQKDLHVLEKATDPLNVTSFLHAFSSALTMSGKYQASFEIAERLHVLAEKQRLGFIRPFAFIDRCVARIGLREFARARQDVDLAASAIPLEGDAHIEGNLVAIRCRLLIALGCHKEAVESTYVSFRSGRPTAPLRAEILAGRALALACANQRTGALREVKEAERTSAKALETQVLGPAVRAICALAKRHGQEFVSATWDAAVETGNFNALVSAYRGCPELLGEIANRAESDQLGSLLRAANDVQLANRFGIMLQAPAMHLATLTRRETEVMNLVVSGLSNKEAARTLFVTEGTIKAHLRHIYEKLGVRGRPQAVAKWLTRP
jgi:DNA-binding CsgD family transcriptional regulator/tetratricopeptide (TPR) repeat protein